MGERTLIRDGVRLEVVCDHYGRKPRLSIGSEQELSRMCTSFRFATSRWLPEKKTPVTSKIHTESNFLG